MDNLLTLIESGKIRTRETAAALGSLKHALGQLQQWPESPAAQDYFTQARHKWEVARERQYDADEAIHQEAGK